MTGIVLLETLMYEIRSPCTLTQCLQALSNLHTITRSQPLRNYRHRPYVVDAHMRTSNASTRRTTKVKWVVVAEDSSTSVLVQLVHLIHEPKEWHREE